MRDVPIAPLEGPNFVTYPGSPFRLNQPYPPAGDQPRAIEKLIEGVNDGLAFQTLLGVTGSGKTYTMANVIAQLGRPAMVLAPNKTLAAQLYSEMREFFPENSVEYFVSYYDYYQPEAYVPARDLFIEKDSSINEHIEQMRLSATKSLMERRDVVIVATVSAIYGIGDPAEYHTMILHLRVGEKYSQRDVIQRLATMQYDRNEMDFRRGTFRVRGDVIDVFPAEHAEHAVRISLFDDEIEALTLFDPLTGHTLQGLSRFTVYPSSHYVTPRATTLKAVDAIKLELADRIKYFLGATRLVEAQRIEQRTRFDLEMLNELGFCKGIENYSRHLSGRKAGDPPPTLIDYLPHDALMVIDESHVTIGQLGGMYKGDRSRKENLVEYGFRLPSALDNRPLRFDEFEKIVRQTVFVSATPANYLLREGLDLPEVSLVAILDADKEGFLRSERSLIQTIGRAARHINGSAILYADRITDSMKAAMGETERRRNRQIAHNLANGIEPKGISKKIRDLIDGVYDADEAHATLRAAKDEARYERMSEKELAREIKRLEKEMVSHARNLEFEKAAEARDQLHELRKRMFGVEIASD